MPNIMEGQRGNLGKGDLEVGVTEMFRAHSGPHVAQRAQAPGWLLKWESARPRWLMELMAEAFGVFFFCYIAESASAALYVANQGGQINMGSLLTVAICVGVSIGLSVIFTGPTSGGHLNPGLTINFAIFKGFPWRKVPQYIFAQLLGAFLASFMVYVHFAPELLAGARADIANGQDIFVPGGPAAALAFFVRPDRDLRLTFVNELMCSVVVGTAIFSILDPTNPFVSPTTGPMLISFVFVLAISCFGVNSVSLNTARDVGSRFAVGALFGRGAFQGNYCAVASLTNILGMFLGAAFQILVLSDTVRPPTEEAKCSYHAQMETEQAQRIRELEARGNGDSKSMRGSIAHNNNKPSPTQSEKPLYGPDAV